MITQGLESKQGKFGSRYDLVLIAAQRAKQIQEGQAPLIQSLSTHPLTLALEEIEAGVYPPPEKPADIVDDTVLESSIAAIADDLAAEAELTPASGKTGDDALLSAIRAVSTSDRSGESEAVESDAILGEVSPGSAPEGVDALTSDDFASSDTQSGETE